MHQFVVRSSSRDPTLSQALTVPTLTSMASLLNQGEGLISSPHHVTLVLSALQLVPLDRLPSPAYRSTFHAVHETLFAVVSCHPQVRPVTRDGRGVWKGTAKYWFRFPS